MRDTGYTGPSVVKGMASLVAKSLVVLDGPAVAGRWRMFETTRAYALGKRAESGGTAQITVIARAARCVQSADALDAPSNISP